MFVSTEKQLVVTYSVRVSLKEAEVPFIMNDTSQLGNVIPCSLKRIKEHRMWRSGLLLSVI
jgi:hypothetical protein